MQEDLENPCSACGGLAFIPGPDRNKYVCARCNKTVPAQRYFSPANKNLTQPTPLRLGMKAQIRAKEFYLVSIVHYCQVVKNAESGANERYYWHEFVLLTPDGEELYLEFEDGKWQMSEPCEPDERANLPLLLRSREGAIVPIYQISATVSDAGTCHVEDYCGASPWPIRKGKSSRFVDLDHSSGIKYAIVSDEDFDNVEWYRRRPITDREVLTYFGLSQLIQKDIAKEAKASGQSGFGWICIGLAFFAFATWLMMPNRGVMIAQGTTGGMAVPEEGLRFGPFTLKETSRLSRFHLSTAIPDNSSTWAQGVIETPEGKALFGLDGEFWRESGYDEGYWSESVTSAQQEFHLDKQRQVYVRIFTDPDGRNGTAHVPGSRESPVNFSIEEGVSYPNHLLWFAFPTLGLGIVFMVMSSATMKAKAWNS